MPEMSPRRRKSARALGPYRHAAGWRVVEVAADGSRTRSQFDSEAQARTYKQLLDEKLAAGDFTTETALEEYERHLTDKGNRPTSIARTRWSVEKFFPDPLPLWALRERKCAALYESLRTRPSPRTGKPLAADSHRNILAEVKTFLGWCVTQGWLGANPAASIQGVGKRRRGKPQLRIRHARAWYATAHRLADEGDSGALAALCALLLGMRASEIVALRVRDIDEVDAPCDTVWIDRAKTDAGRRDIEVPEALRVLLESYTRGLRGDDLVFATALKGGRRKGHWRDWPRHQVKRIARVAELPEDVAAGITAHSMRGMLADYGLRRGAVGEHVAAALGHEDVRTTSEAYARPGAAEQGKRRRGLRVIAGGRET